NERLEFLGDSVLGLCVSDYLFRRLPDRPEGELSQLRSRLVDANSCAKFLQMLNLAEYILLGKGETNTEGRTKPSILADVFEAILGAIYLDGGLEAAQSFLQRHFQSFFEEAIQMPYDNSKAILQNLSQKKFQKPPTYKIIQESGPDHSKTFQVAVFVDGKQVGEGSGACKKEAEQNAAKDALSKELFE